MVMSVFAYIYHQSFVVPQDYSVEMIMDQVSFHLDVFISDSNKRMCHVASISS